MESERDEDEYAFTVNSVTSPEKIDVTVGGVVARLIDFGENTNVIDRNLWSKLKQDKIKCASKKEKKLDAYGSKQPMEVLGTFSALARVEGKEAEASQVRSFLKLANYNARFIPYFATVAEPMRRLTKKGVHFEFEEEQKDAFNELKGRLSSAETLGYFDEDAQTLIIADASQVGLVAILIQEQQGRKRVISYESKSLSAVERCY